MFSGCNKLLSLDLSNFDTSNVTSMASMFNNCASLTSLNISNFDTSNVTDMSNMFKRCVTLTSLYLSNFNTSNVTNMSYMFSECSELLSLDVSNFDTSNVGNMREMFSYCYALTLLDLSSFNTSHTGRMWMMFRNCENLQHIYVSNLWEVSQVYESAGMFSYCVNLHNYNSSYQDKTKAIIDDGTNGGYLEMLRTINKVTYGNRILIDLTNDTVSRSDVRSGISFHLPNGACSIGTLIVNNNVISNENQLPNSNSINKVTYNNQVLIDLTSDTVTAGDVRQGVTFHLPNGEIATGTLII